MVASLMYIVYIRLNPALTSCDTLLFPGKDITIQMSAHSYSHTPGNDTGEKRNRVLTKKRSELEHAEVNKALCPDNGCISVTVISRFCTGDLHYRLIFE